MTHNHLACSVLAPSWAFVLVSRLARGILVLDWVIRRAGVSWPDGRSSSFLLHMVRTASDTLDWTRGHDGIQVPDLDNPSPCIGLVIHALGNSTPSLLQPANQTSNPSRQRAPTFPLSQTGNVSCMFHIILSTCSVLLCNSL